MFIAKDNNIYKTFVNARPITKTSPIYKLMDKILKNRITEELNPNNKFKLIKEQIGFRKGMGCEVNILRLKENLTWRRN